MENRVNHREVEQLTEQLLDLLCEHLAAHRELAEVLEEKERAVVALELELLDEIVERERAIINRIGVLEERRCALTERIGKLIEHPDPTSLRLSGIVPYVSPELADTLIDIREELRNTADRIEKIQDRNRVLIQHSLDHIHLFLSVVSGVDSALKDYSPHGPEPGTASPTVLDRRL